MHISYDFIEADFQRNVAMLRKSSATKPTKLAGWLVAAYFGMSLWLFQSFCPLNEVQYYAMIAYSLGLVAVFAFGIKSLVRRSTNGFKMKALGPKEYSIKNGILTVKTRDIQQMISAAQISKVESSDRGTLIHLPMHSPVFIPFGTGHRPDFISALNSEIQNATIEASKPKASGGALAIEPPLLP